MQLPSTLSWLLDEASSLPGADQFLTALGSRLIADGLPLAGGTLTLTAPHPMIARRTWLWRENEPVIEALGFGALAEAPPKQQDVGLEWLRSLGTGIVRETAAGAVAQHDEPDRPRIAWALSRPL